MLWGSGHIDCHLRRWVIVSSSLARLHSVWSAHIIVPHDSPRDNHYACMFSPRGIGNSRLLGGLSYEKIRRYNNSHPYVTARWPPQQIPPLNFLGFYTVLTSPAAPMHGPHVILNTHSVCQAYLVDPIWKKNNNNNNNNNFNVLLSENKFLTYSIWLAGNQGRGVLFIQVGYHLRKRNFKTHPFFPQFCTPKRCVHVHYLVRKTTPY